jgi:excisionase family DNA binding protein
MNLLTLQQVAAELNVSVKTIRGLIRVGLLKCVKINARLWRVRRAALEQFIARREH